MSENVVAPFQGYILGHLLVCTVCSALVPDWPEAKLNHERWHAAQSDGRADV